MAKRSPKKVLPKFILLLLFFTTILPLNFAEAGNGRVVVIDGVVF